VSEGTISQKKEDRGDDGWSLSIEGDFPENREIHPENPY
jgi:hypothetical protein